MKRMALAVLATLALASAANAEIKVEALSWLDNGVNLGTNFSYNAGSAFDISRLYFTVQGDIGKDWFGNGIKGRVSLDFAKAEFSKTASITTNSTGTVKAINSFSAFPIKYAYVDWTLFTLKDSTDVKLFDLVLSGGQLKTFYGNIADWTYQMPVKDAVEVFGGNMKNSASSDLGLMLSGSVLNGLIKYYAQILNGEGYETLFTDTSATGNYYAFSGQIQVMPINGLKIAGSVKMNDYNTDTKQTENSWNALLEVKNLTLGDGDTAPVIPIDFLAQVQSLMYGSYANPTNSSLVYSVMLGYGFLPADPTDLKTATLFPYVRYDFGQANNNPAVTNYTQNIYVSANILPNKNFAIRPLFQTTLATVNTNVTTSYYAKLELEYKINFSVWQ